jgi:CRP-like cAMP-binding protein
MNPDGRSGCSADGLVRKDRKPPVHPHPADTAGTPPHRDPCTTIRALGPNVDPVDRWERPYYNGNGSSRQGAPSGGALYRCSQGRRGAMILQLKRPYCGSCEKRIHSILRDLDDYALENVDSTKACYVYKKGQVIFSEGIPPTGLFCLHRGKVKVYKTGDEGREKIVRLARDGDVIGYRALLTGEPSTVSAAALEESVICCIPQDTFSKLLRANGGFSMRIIELLSAELGRAEEQIVHIAQRPVRERLAETLLLLKETFGTEDGDSSAINVRLSREELAGIVGTAIETLVRAIAEFKRERLISTEKKKIRILDLPRLLEIGNIHD